MKRQKYRNLESTKVKSGKYEKTKVTVIRNQKPRIKKKSKVKSENWKTMSQEPRKVKSEQ